MTSSNRKSTNKIKQKIKQNVCLQIMTSWEFSNRRLSNIGALSKRLINYHQNACAAAERMHNGWLVQHPPHVPVLLI